MDWIERSFGVSPDGGSGLTETLYVVALLAIVALILWRVGLLRHGVVILRGIVLPGFGAHRKDSDE
jgi:hypothetical protein